MDVGSGCGAESRPSRSVCWYRLNERDPGSDGVEGQDGCDDQVEKTKDVGSNCQSHRMTIDPSKAFRLKAQHDVCASVAAHEYVGGTSDTDEDENHNTWNALVEALTMPGSSPALQQSLQDWEVCRVALSCPFALDILYMSMAW